MRGRQPTWQRQPTRHQPNYVIDQDGFIISRVAPDLRADPPATTLDDVSVTAEAPSQGNDFGGGGDLTPQPAATGSATPPTLYGNWQPALFMPYKRSIGGIVAQVTIEETATDDVTITEHPVEQGAPIADHAFKRPATVTIRAGWSVTGAYDLSAETGVYGLLLSWQAALLPFDVVIGKRRLPNMLMERLVVRTDEKSEYALMADITCRQVIIVGTQTTSNQTASDSPSDQKDSEETASPAEKGDQQTRDAGKGGLVDEPYPDKPGMPGTYRPPAGGDDSVMLPEGQKVEGTITGANQPQYGATTGGVGAGLGSEASMGTASPNYIGNVTPTGLNEKGMTTVQPSPGPTDAITFANPLMAPLTMRFPTTGVHAEHQQLMRNAAWQRTQRYQPRRGARSRSV